MKLHGSAPGFFGSRTASASGVRRPTAGCVLARLQRNGFGHVLHRGLASALCLGSLSLGSLCLTGCGRPATEGECRIILRRAAELQLKGQLDVSREVVQAELDAIEASMKDAMMQKCVGKRITDGALACVKAAKSSKELLDECLD